MRLDRVITTLTSAQVWPIVADVLGRVRPSVSDQDLDDYRSQVASLVSPGDDILIEPIVAVGADHVPLAVNAEVVDEGLVEVCFFTGAPLTDWAEQAIQKYAPGANVRTLRG